MKILCFSCVEEFEVVEEENGILYLMHDCKRYEQQFEQKRIIRIKVLNEG